MCVCVKESERGRETEREGDREGGEKGKIDKNREMEMWSSYLNLITSKLFMIYLKIEKDWSLIGKLSTR